MKMVAKKNMKTAMACGRALRTSTRKLNLVAASIRGMAVEKALTQLTFSPRRIAGEVKKVLQSAIANAENNHNMDVNNLYVAECFVGEGPTLKRVRPRAQGRAFRVFKRTSNITIVLKEKE